MTTQDISEKSVLRIMQREQERERRRIRDRQRRQSMSLEEREKHLARRRRNYQLRRQKADNSQSDSQCKQTSATTGGDQNTRNEYQAATNSSELCVQSEVITHIGLNQGQDKLDVSSIKFEDMEAGGHKLAKFPRRLRLSHVRHLARSINNPMDELTGDNHPIGADAVTKKNASSKFGGTDPGSPKRLRLNHVKRLARAVHSTVKESASHKSKE